MLNITLYILVFQLDQEQEQDPALFSNIDNTSKLLNYYISPH